ncbi:amidohydrolase family protein [Streptomyces sp. 3MP-14]|uniref:Amidohydrolase family protein n=1 Tax=Streptomyces mimosae TaxID=2586635 RepID=A0A5N6A909_9ACTN|nr:MULTISPECIES: amidohydrolase family protein [Streptomyces]KAB8165297.1 amidohydrolase family protein [Streptomyces mimosae]KAB8175929.1 amidohydrolase family protein [Streptomyces sp. 3MP-14]
MTRVLLTGAAVLDVASGRTERADVLLEGERIAAVGTGLDGDAAVDCAGGLLVPGFVDCHAHVCLGASLGAHDAPEARPRSLRALSAVPALRALLDQGITTVRDAWGADAGLRIALERGWFEGPEVLLSLRQVCTTGGIGDHWAPRYGPVDSFGDPALPDPVFDGPDQARAAVRRMVRAGADWIKVTATGSLSLGRGVHDLQLTDAELCAVVDEAQRQGGRGVMVHAHGARAAEQAARAGARSVEHGTFLDERAVSAMAEAGTWLVPTLSTSHGEPTAHAADHRRAVQLALAAGVPVAMGTDAPVRPYAEALREIHYLAEAGLGQAGALRAATLDAARLLRLQDDRGEIAVGKRADLVLLAGTDLATESLAARVRAVWRGGREAARPRG